MVCYANIDETIHSYVYANQPSLELFDDLLQHLLARPPDRRRKVQRVQRLHLRVDACAAASADARMHAYTHTQKQRTHIW
jgi:hypothetical protein